MVKVICIVGADGSGKTTLAKYLVGELEKRGRRATLVWMRFSNYLSKTLLAFARLRGYSYYKNVDGIKMGYHDFEKVWWLQWPFAFLQMVDVNIAARRKFRALKGFDVAVFERSAWDTLSDVMADTGIVELEKSWIGRNMVRAFRGKCDVLWINRRPDLIRQSRRELVADNKLDCKTANYARMSRFFNWTEIDNNGSIDEVRRRLSAWLDGCLTLENEPK